MSRLLVILLLSGCATTNETRRSQSRTITERHPTPDGGFIEKQTRYDEGETETSTKSDVEWAGAVSKGIGQAATGDWIGLAATGVTALLAGGAAVVKHREAIHARKGEDEAWDRLLPKESSNG